MKGWVDAMPNTIIGLCSVAIITIVLGTIGVFLPNTTLSVSAYIFGMVGTLVALVVGARLDVKRIKRQ